VISAWMAAENATNWQRRCFLDPISHATHMAQMRTISEYREAAVAAGFSIGECEDLSEKVARTWPSVSRTFLRALARNPRYVKFLVGRHAANRRFGLTIARIWIAYRLKALRYFLLVLTAI
jgi:tocopherol O-methyltransferase